MHDKPGISSTYSGDNRINYELKVKKRRKESAFTYDL